MISESTGLANGGAGPRILERRGRMIIFPTDLESVN